MTVFFSNLIFMFSDLLTSKKFAMTVAAGICYLIGKLGFHADASELAVALTPFLGYLVAQGLADHGKSAAQITADNTPTQVITSTPTGTTATTVVTPAPVVPTPVISGTVSTPRVDQSGVQRGFGTLGLVGIIALIAVLAMFCGACGARGTAALNTIKTCASSDIQADESAILPTVTAILANPADIATTLITALLTTVVPQAVECAILTAESAAKTPVATVPVPATNPKTGEAFFTQPTQAELAAQVARNALISANADKILRAKGWR